MLRYLITKYPTLLVVSLLLFVFILSQSTCGGSHENTKAETATATPTSTQGKSLFTSAQTFQQEFNAVCRAADLNFRIEHAVIKQGEVQDVCIYTISDNLGIDATINKSDGTVKEVFMIGVGDGSFESGGNMVLCMVTMITVIDPSLTGDERMNILKSLHLAGGYDISDLQTQTYKNGDKYWATASTTTGVMFGASKE